MNKCKSCTFKTTGPITQPNNGRAVCFTALLWGRIVVSLYDCIYNHKETPPQSYIWHCLFVIHSVIHGCFNNLFIQNNSCHCCLKWVFHIFLFPLHLTPTVRRTWFAVIIYASSGGAESSTTVFWLRTSKRRSPLVCQSVPPCLAKPSFPPDSQIMCSRVTDVLHKPPPPLCSPSSLCRLCSQKGDEQLRRTAGRSLGGLDLPPWRASLPVCLPPHFSEFFCACCQTLRLALAWGWANQESGCQACT